MEYDHWLTFSPFTKERAKATRCIGTFIIGWAAFRSRYSPNSCSNWKDLERSPSKAVTLPAKCLEVGRFNTPSTPAWSPLLSSPPPPPPSSPPPPPPSSPPPPPPSPPPCPGGGPMSLPLPKVWVGGCTTSLICPCWLSCCIS